MIPLILLATAFILIRIYPLDRQAMEDVQTKIAAKRLKGSDQKDVDGESVI